MDAPPEGQIVNRRRILLPGLLPTAICAALVVSSPALLTRLDFAAYDTLLQFTRPAPPDGRVVIVDVDERSLATIGQWPWRRDVVGQLITRLRGMRARAIALDIIFSEPDRGGAQTGGSDALLAETLRGGNVVVGHAFTFGNAGSNAARCVLHPLNVVVVQPGAAPESPLFHATDAICSLPVLARAAGVSGFLNAAPDSDGILRRVPLALEMDGRVYPGLALATMGTLSAPHSGELRVVNANTTSLTLGQLAVPLDGRSNLLLRYRGGKRAFRYVSAADVLGGTVRADAILGKLVFVGATALGTQELVATPYDPLFPGVEVQATIADNLLRGDFIRRPEHSVIFETLVVIGLGVGIAWVVGRIGIAWGSVVAVALVTGLWAGAAWLLSASGMFLSPLVATTGIVITVAAAAFTSLTYEVRTALAGLRRARRETETATRAKDEFLTTVSHELRTPLTAIYGYAQILAKGALKGDQKNRALETIERNAMAQTQLIDDLLDTSQVISGRLRLDVKGVNLADVIRTVADATAPAVAAKRISFHTTIDDGINRVPGDSHRLQQVVWHLVSNAIKFTPADGRVDVRLARTGSFAQITVADNGAGISPEFMPHVFEQFRQQDAGTTREFGGLGLGLALVRYLVELHGGSVDAQSEGEGRGATFRVRLPLRAIPADAPLADPVNAIGECLDGVRVLLVDDQPGTRTLLASALLRAGANVVTAATTGDAHAMLREETRDVLVVNVDLPYGEGYQLAREAFGLATNRGERLSTIAIGAADRIGDTTQAPAAGIERHLATPVSPVQLVSAIAAVMRAHTS